mmetsp:Transcript_9240/g.16407  ORF Transcript_9240/g.16407 Transcript_9240/m.16407 type:complete len:238 (+) Transcript_9240:154-867(+)
MPRPGLDPSPHGPPGGQPGWVHADPVGRIHPHGPVGRICPHGHITAGPVAGSAPQTRGPTHGGVSCASNPRQPTKCTLARGTGTDHPPRRAGSRGCPGSGPPSSVGPAVEGTGTGPTPLDALRCDDGRLRGIPGEDRPQPGLLRRPGGHQGRHRRRAEEGPSEDRPQVPPGRDQGAGDCVEVQGSERGLPHPPRSRVTGTVRLCAGQPLQECWGWCRPEQLAGQLAPALQHIQWGGG